MDRQPEYFQKELSRNKLDKAIYGLVVVVRLEAEDPDLPVFQVLKMAHKSCSNMYKGVKPKRLGNYLAIRRLLLDSETNRALSVVRKADIQMLGE